MTAATRPEAPLPLRPRPRHGETADSYLRRLAAANHLRFSYLRRYLEGLNRVLAEPLEDCLAVDERGEPCLEIKSPVDLERELALNRGNIFHGDLSWFFAENPDDAGRWGVETHYERIYLAGSSAVRGGAVSGIPGRNAARCIFEELRLTTPLAHG